MHKIFSGSVSMQSRMSIRDKSGRFYRKDFILLSKRKLRDIKSAAKKRE